MKAQGKSKDNALLRTLANKKSINFASRRILRDLKEIEDESIPTVGVTARPQDNSLFKWHANIQGPPGTIYSGGVFHLTIDIPESYPHQPPVVNLLTSLPHPNVFGQNICLDMLTAQREGDASGWSSGYSIQSILMQLQSFLFEVQYVENEQQFEAKVKQAIKNANEFKCSECKHGGKLSCWPEFNKKEKDSNAFQVVDYNENSFFSKELMCYHTKMSFRPQEVPGQEQLKGVCLGYGLKITKVPRTGAIQNAQATLDYISIKAFIKEGIRWSVNNETFTNWMPLYLGKEDDKSRALHLGRRSLAMIMANNTRRFKPEFILEVFPKIIITSIFLMVDQKRHTSIVMIRQFAHIHANFLLFMEEYPELYDIVDKKLEEFINDESKRIKDHSPNLSVILTYLLVSKKYKFQDILEAYHQESLDRQVFWIFKSVPELTNEANQHVLTKERAKLTFKCQEISNQMLCLFSLFINKVKSIAAEPKKLLEYYENNFCKLPVKLENEIQSQAFHIYKNVTFYDQFYEFLGIPVKSNEELNKQLMQAIQNSKAKRYHGELDDIHTLPTSQNQIQSLLDKIPKMHNFYECKTIQVSKEGQQKKEHKIEVISKRNLNEDEWKLACETRWSWIKEALVNNSTLNSTDIARMSIEQFKEGEEVDKEKNNRVFTSIKEKMKKQTIPNQNCSIEMMKHTWQQVFFKLELEDSMIYFDQNPDFEKFYEKLKIAKDYITCLTIPVISVQNVKSGYYYVTQVIGQLTNLKFLEFSGLPEVCTSVCMKAIKAINKGMNNFLAGKGMLEGISFHNFRASGNGSEITDKIFTPLFQMKDLVSIKLSKTNLLHHQNASKSLCNIITNLKNLQELVLTNNVFSDHTQAKEVADGLMRSKRLTYVDLRDNSLMGFSGMASLAYNLAFATNLYSLNLSRCCPTSQGGIQDVVEAVFKLIKINSSLEVLDCSNINNFNTNLQKEFFVHLGEIKTLRVLNLSHSSQFNNSVITNLGKAIAFNAKKGGALEYLDFTGTINSSTILKTMYLNMCVSEHDHEVWYGDPTKAQKMSGSDHEKHLYNNLKALYFDKCGINSHFNINDFVKYNNKDPEILQLFSRCPKIESLTLSSCSLNKNDADLLSLALDPTREGFASRIKVLNLSKNLINKEGAKIIASILEKNNIIEIVDLSKNQIGVSGAQALAQKLEKNTSVKFLNIFNNKIGFDGAQAFGNTFKVNCTLEQVEFGHNRIRNKGLYSLGEGIAQNPKSKINTLGLRFNFLNEDGIIDFLKVTKGSKGLAEVFIKNNSINEYGLFQLKKAHENLKSSLKVDLFEKLKYLDEEKLERTVYVHPIKVTRAQIKHFFEKTQVCGIVVDVRIRKGPKWPNRQVNENKFAMIEFADQNSVTRALTVASRKKSVISGQKFRIYKAGTGTYIYQKKSSKQKKAETSKTNVISSTENATTSLYAARGKSTEPRVTKSYAAASRGASTGASRGGRGGLRR